MFDLKRLIEDLWYLLLIVEKIPNGKKGQLIITIKKKNTV